MFSTRTDYRGKHPRLKLWSQYKAPKDAYDLFLIQLLRPEKGSLILDDGSGNGRFSQAVRLMGYNVVAVDLSAQLVKQTNRRQIPVVRADMTYLPFRTGSFDRVLCVHNLWYVSNYAGAIHEMLRVTRIEGVCVADHINLLDWRRFTSWRFYALLIKGIMRRNIIDVGRTASAFKAPFVGVKLTVISMESLGPPLRIKDGAKRFTKRFVAVGVRK